MTTTETIIANLKRLIAEKGTNNSALALAAGLNHTAARDIVSGRVKLPSYDTLHKLAHALGVPVSEIVGEGFARVVQSVRVVGRVSAGAGLPALETDHESEPLYLVQAPDVLANPNLMAVEVEGESMQPTYQDGHVLFFHKETDGVSAYDIGKPCVIECEDGRAWMKLLTLGDSPGLFHLLSLNPMSPSMHNQRVRWAARVRLALPAELVERMP